MPPVNAATVESVASSSSWLTRHHFLNFEPWIHGQVNGYQGTDLGIRIGKETGACAWSSSSDDFLLGTKYVHGKLKVLHVSYSQYSTPAVPKILFTHLNSAAMKIQ